MIKIINRSLTKPINQNSPQLNKIIPKANFINLQKSLIDVYSTTINLPKKKITNLISSKRHLINSIKTLIKHLKKSFYKQLKNKLN